MVKALPSQGFLHELFSYDKESGELIWRGRPQSHFKSDNEWRRWNTRYAGKSSGTIIRPEAPRRMVTINHLDYPAHRIIWKLVTGSEPPEVDHRDRDGTNNKFSNLREATHEQNCQNRVRAKKSTMPTGVRYSGRRFYAAITVNGERRHLGMFDSELEASLAYRSAAQSLHGEFAAEAANG